MSDILFRAIDWSTVEKTEHKGLAGTAWWQTIQFNGLRVRVVEYSAGYMADHWCQKGHVVHCLAGAFRSEMQTGEDFMLEKGMSYVVSDNLSSHRSVSENGATLLIIDGDFLKNGPA